MKKYQAKIDATVVLQVWLNEYDDGELEVDEVLEIYEIIDIENVREPY